jgi:hypothetical protein
LDQLIFAGTVAAIVIALIVAVKRPTRVVTP